MNPSQINPSPSRVFHRLMYLLQKFDEAPWSSWTSWLNKKSSTPKSQEACNKTHQKKTQKKHLMCEKARTYTCIHYNFYIYILPINIGLYVSMNIYVFDGFFQVSASWCPPLAPQTTLPDLQTSGAVATAGDSSWWVESTLSEKYATVKLDHFYK